MIAGAWLLVAVSVTACAPSRIALDPGVRNQPPSALAIHESFHSRNGFSRARLPAERAHEFDDTLKTLVRRYCQDDTVRLPVQARIAWGRPMAM